MTYSIVARDPRTGDIGIAVQSRFFAAGRVVPSIEAGVGVIASQSFFNPIYGTEGMRLMREGATPDDALKRLVAEDSGAALRQVAILDTKGRVAIHTGASCVAAAGHNIGEQCSAQANMMRQSTVWPAMIKAFERASGALPERLVEAMEAAEREGGDLRGKQAAALIVVSNDPRTQDSRVDLRVDDHADPVREIKRQLAYLRAHRHALGSLGKISAGDFNGALSDLDACCNAYPEEPEFLTRRAGALLALGRMREARDMMERACAIDPGWAEFVWRLSESGVVPIPREALAPLVSGLRDNSSA